MTKPKAPVLKSLCEGSCDAHVGDLKLVHVLDRQYGHDWKYFTYCESAIQEDLNRGFEVIEVEL